MNTDPHHLVGGMSRYDMEYMHHYTGVDIQMVPAYSAVYTSAAGPYNVTKPGALFFPSRDTEIPIRYLEAIHVPLPEGVVFGRDLYHHYELSDLTKHKAIVLLPYSVMSYKLTEYYSLCVPLFVPSIRYLRDHSGLGSDRAVASDHYCGREERIDRDMKAHKMSKHPYR